MWWTLYKETDKARGDFLKSRCCDGAKMAND